jgi:type II secretory ATPase GspE/PulE/Tfp pilus assembly ATPase PilB-like protein
LFDINIKTIDDILNVLLKKQYEYVSIEPFNEYIKIFFKKNSVEKEIKYIKYSAYSKILLNAKKITKLNLEKTDIEQK